MCSSDLFWMGWTAYPSVSYWSPLVASVLFGYGILCIFISSYQYLMDAYAMYAASALAAVTLVSPPYLQSRIIHWLTSDLDTIRSGWWHGGGRDPHVLEFGRALDNDDPGLHQSVDGASPVRVLLLRA